MQILPSLTSISGKWLEKLKEIKELKLKEICLFPTCLNKKEREKLYSLLKETSVKNIPLVHLRNDMTIEEMDYLMENYSTKVFNTHSKEEHPFLYDYGKYKKLIYIENSYKPFDEEEVKEFAGVCLDIAHLETDRLLNPKQYQHNIKIIKKYKIGCNHISAIKKETRLDKRNALRYDSHYIEELSEFDYLKSYPLTFFAEYVTVEVENTILEQLEALKYINNLLNL